MIVMDMHFEDGTVRHAQFALPAVAGRNKECQIYLRSWRVARRHAQLVRRQAGIFIEDLGSLAGTLVNGLRITEYGPLEISDEILIGPCRMVVRFVNTSGSVTDTWGFARGAIGACDSYDRAAVACGFGGDAAVVGQSARISTVVPMHDDVPLTRAAAKPDQSSVSQVSALSDSNLTRELLPAKSGSDNTSSATAAARTTSTAAAICKVQHATDTNDIDPLRVSQHIAHYQQLRLQLHSSLLKALDLRRKDVSQMTDAALRLEAADLLDQILTRDLSLPNDIDRQQLRQDVLDEAIGLGPLEPLLADREVTEIMVNRYDELFIEKAGRLSRYSGAFSSEKSVLGIIDRIVAPLGRRIDESSPMVDARLKDGSRVNAVIPPIALRGASLTIRKFPDFRPGMHDLIRLGSMDNAMQQFLQLCIEHRKNLIVSGGTGSGKTTLLNILSNCIPDHERIITIEDAAELRLNHTHLVSLEARPANIEGKGQVQIRDLVRNALRMRPDRIVVGECRGAEAFDMLAAMNTGHEGSLTTLHANTPRDALARLETMILMAGMELPLTAVREHIAASIDFIIQQSRLASGRRLITSITEICGLESGIIKSQEIFRYDRKGEGAFVGQGIVPECFDTLRADGLEIDATIFNQTTRVATGANTFVRSEMHLPATYPSIGER